MFFSVVPSALLDDVGILARGATPVCDRLPFQDFHSAAKQPLLALQGLYTALQRL